MRTAVILSLGASFLLGTGALLVAHAWVTPPPAPPTVRPAVVPTVPVVVANAALAYGDTVAANKLTVVRFPVNLAPPGAFASIDQLVDAKGPPTIVLAAIAPREPVLPTMVTGRGSRNSISAQIAPGMRAYAIKISDVAGVGGHALPGDRVDVILTRPPQQRPSAPAGEHDLVSDVVVQDVRLLGVNLNVDPASTAAAAQADPRTATLEVSLLDAQKLALAGGIGMLSLALRRVGAADATAVRQVLVNDLAPAGARPMPVVRRPRRPSAPAASVAGMASLMIIHGDHDASVSVPAERRKGA